jgi:hypothetical protein
VNCNSKHNFIGVFHLHVCHIPTPFGLLEAAICTSCNIYACLIMIVMQLNLRNLAFSYINPWLCESKAWQFGSTIVIHNTILEQINVFTYLGCKIS